MNSKPLGAMDTHNHGLTPSDLVALDGPITVATPATQPMAALATPGPADVAAPTGAAGKRLAQVEVLDRDGHVQQVVDVTAWPLTLGRALDNHVVLSDPHIAAHHATLWPDEAADGTLLLLAGPSVNGVLIEPAAVAAIATVGATVGGAARRLPGNLSKPRPKQAPAVWLKDGERTHLPPLAQWRLGQTLLRVRRLEDPVPAELPLLPHGARAPVRLTALLAGLGLAWLLGATWLQSAPDTKWLDYLGPVVGMVMALATWVLVWALMTKVFSGRFVVQAHLQLALAVGLAIELAELALPALSFALDWPWLSRLVPMVTALMAAWLVVAHLAIVAPRHAGRMRAVVAAMVLAGLGIQMVTTWQRGDRLFSELYASTLFPPALRVVPAAPVEQLTQELRTLEQSLQARARKAKAEDFEP
jgi:hypothetical protein